jgi:PQQ-dependent dehydrogenase (methanol/ethanol family)
MVHRNSQVSVLLPLLTWAALLSPSQFPAFAQPAQPPARFEALCSGCHGGGGAGGDRAPALVDSAQLRAMDTAQIKQVIQQGLPGGMPAFDLDQQDLDSMAGWLHEQNPSASAAPSAARARLGELFFFAKGRCSTCHMVRGRGATNGPDLSDVAVRSTPAAMETVLRDPTSQMGSRSTAACPSWAFCPDNAWGVATVELRSGATLRGFVRGEGEHDVQLQTFDGQFHLLSDQDYRRITHETRSFMPPLAASAEDRRDLLAYLQTLDGASIGPLASAPLPQRSDIDRVLRPKRGEWPSYDGSPAGNRYSPLDQIDTHTVAKLQPQWSFAPGGTGLETTPLVSDGVMFVTGTTQVCALDAATGRPIWCTPRSAPRGRPANPPQQRAPTAVGPNRGVALLGDAVFFTTDDAYLVSLNRVTGAVLWSVPLADAAHPGRYYTSAAPMVVGDLVITGVGGGDSPLRGFVGAWKAATGTLAWRLWTIPNPGEPLAETWRGRDLPTGGGATWTSGSYDPEAGLLYWAVGNPYPATNGDERGGSNLYTASVLALDPRTGLVKWHFQFSPHDLHDWDANEPLVLADASYRGEQRKLLLQANRNGFFYVLDRISGAFLFAKPFVKKLTWAGGVNADGVPQWLPNNEPTVEGVRTCPSVRGATNWYASAFNPRTDLFYVMAAEDCSIYRKVGKGYAGDRNPRDPGKRYLRAIDISDGAIAWEKPLSGSQEENYTGVLATAGNLIFHGETGGGFAAVDAQSGATLWMFRANEPWKASPMTYLLRGRQYVAVAAGSHILAFALPQDLVESHIIE